jgi:hypothetical protein
VGSAPAFEDTKQMGTGDTEDAFVMGIVTKDFWGSICTSITNST